MSSYNTKEIIESSLENVNTLKGQLIRMDKMRDDVQQIIKSGAKIQQEFSVLGNDISTKNAEFIDANYKLLKGEILLFEKKLTSLDDKIAELNNLDLKSVFEEANVSFAESLDNLFDSRFKDLKDMYSDFNSGLTKLDSKIEKLDNMDLKSAFQEANNSFSKSLNSLFDERFKDLRVLYSGFEKLQKDFSAEISALKAIDLEEHFFKHDKRLSEIFSSVNSVNGTLLSINEYLIKTQTIVSNLDKVFSETINAFETKINAKLDAITKKLETKVDALNGRVNTLLILLVISVLISLIGLFLSMKSLF